MRRAVMIASAFALSACGSLGSLGTGSGGSLGSIGSLGGGERVAAMRSRETLPPLVPAEQRVIVQDARSLATRISSAELTAASGGAILRVTAPPPVGGSYNAELVPQGRRDGTLTYAFKMNVQPGTRIEPTRVTAARWIGNEELRGVRAVRVIAANGSRTLSR